MMMTAHADDDMATAMATSVAIAVGPGRDEAGSDGWDGEPGGT